MILVDLSTIPSVINTEPKIAVKSAAVTDPSLDNIEESSNDISTTNITPEDITDQLDELIESSPKRAKTDWAGSASDHSDESYKPAQILFSTTIN